MTESEEVVSRETLEDAKGELSSVGGDHVERLAKTLCILLEGVIDKLLEEYEDE